MLYASYAQERITPDITRPVYMAGFASNKQATAIHDDLWARTLLLEDSQQTLALVTVDVIGLVRTHCQAVEQAVRARTGRNISLIIVCSHTHFGPDTIGLWGPGPTESGVDPEYLADLLTTIEETVVTASQTARYAVRARSSAVMVRGVAQNYRDEDILDEEATFIQFLTDDDQSLATFVIYPCHPEVLDPVVTDISADYVNSLRAHLAHELGGGVLFAPGAMGGMMSPAMPGKTHQDAHDMGVIIAGAVQASLKDSPVETVENFEYIRREVPLPIQSFLLEQAVAAGLIADRRGPDEQIVTEVALLRIGSAWFATIPGELFPKIGMQIKADLRLAGARVGGVIGMANDELGYILPEDEYVYPDDPFNPGDHYEETMSVGPKTAPLLLEALYVLFR